MSWTDVYPVLGEEQLEAYQSAATREDELILDDWCGVARTINPRSGKHLVSASLFWKNASGDDGDLPPVTRESMMNAGKLGLVTRFAPWEHYVEPLLEGARLLGEERPDAVFRVYLAADLEFLVGDLVDAGCEVKLMIGSSVRHNPGAMWRFLALEEEGRWVTIVDSDEARLVLHAVRRTERIMATGLGLWRVPYIGSSVRNSDDPGEYRPISACQFGAVGGYPVERLMRAFLWHTHHGTMPDECSVGGKRLPIFATAWPTYGFDEWFLIAVMYPRLAFSGVLTIYSLNDPAANHWFAMDIEYVTWANPQSEILYFEEDRWHERLVRRARETRRESTARSPILESMLAGKRAASSAAREPASRGNPNHLTLAVARYREDLGWLRELPGDVTVVVYNKGPEIRDHALLERIDRLVRLPNQGREADTYLHHLASHPHDSGENWTVFCQGDPFPHSPDFLGLLGHRDLWADVQGLTGRYLEDLPPPHCLTLQDEERIAGIPVRTEVCSASTLDILMWRDDGGRHFFADYCLHHGVPRGWSLSGHFLESCGLTELAGEAWRAERLRFCYGAMFAVRNSRLARIPADCIPAMRELARGHYSNGYVYERLWLHLFGLPFLGSEPPSAG